MKLPAAVDQRNMNSSAGFAWPFDDAETVIAVDDDKPSSIDPSAAVAESLSQANAHLAEQTALLQTLVQATVTAGSKTEAAPAAASAPGSNVSADEESDSDDLEITSIEESEADDEDDEQANKCTSLGGKVMPQDDPAMPQHLRRAGARAYNQSLKVAYDVSEALCGLPDGSGHVPAHFPADYFEFLQFSEDALRGLLAAYGQAPCLPENNFRAAGGDGIGDTVSEALRTQLGRFIGLRRYYGAACLDQHSRPLVHTGAIPAASLPVAAPPSMADLGVPDKPPSAAESADAPAPLPSQQTPPDPVPVPPQQPPPDPVPVPQQQPPPDPVPVPLLQGLTKKQRRNLASAAGGRAAIKAEAKAAKRKAKLDKRRKQCGEASDSAGFLPGA